ncbi:MAG: hypothetical protein E7173_03515 [Firmicutes bacterium]|nr:hypothetical protein [Bacillota bacterium]
MEKLNELINMISKMKKSQKGGMNINNIEERNLVLSLLRELCGEDINPGILWKLSCMVHQYLFNDNYSLRAEQIDGDRVVIMEFEDERAGKTYRKNLCSKFFSEWIKYMDCGTTERIREAEFAADTCKISTYREDVISKFDPNGIEVKRIKIEYNVNAKGFWHDADKIRTTTEWYRVTGNFNFVNEYTWHGLLDDTTKEIREFGQITEQLYSLDAVADRLYSPAVDLSARIERSINSDIAYECMPDLKYAVQMAMYGKISTF